MYYVPPPTIQLRESLQSSALIWCINIFMINAFFMDQSYMNRMAYSYVISSKIWSDAVLKLIDLYVHNEYILMNMS